jgi:hypothetical protein
MIETDIIPICNKLIEDCVIILRKIVENALNSFCNNYNLLRVNV